MRNILGILLFTLSLTLSGQVVRTAVIINPAIAEEGGGNEPPTPDGTIFGWYVGSYSSSFTLDGSNVHIWADSLGSGHDLEYYSGEATSAPGLSSGVVTFDGVNDELRTNNGEGYTMTSPCTFILYVKQITWTSGDRMIAGRDPSSARVYQYDATNELDLYGGTSPGGAACTDLVLDTWAVVAVVFNGVNSFIQVNNGTKRTVTTNVGSTNPNGISLACNPDHTSFGNMAYQEVIVIQGVEDDTNLTAWYNYLNARY